MKKVLSLVMVLFLVAVMVFGFSQKCSAECPQISLKEIFEEIDSFQVSFVEKKFSQLNQEDFKRIADMLGKMLMNDKGIWEKENKIQRSNYSYRKPSVQPFSFVNSDRTYLIKTQKTVHIFSDASKKYSQEATALLFEVILIDSQNLTTKRMYLDINLDGKPEFVFYDFKNRYGDHHTLFLNVTPKEEFLYKFLLAQTILEKFPLR